MRLLIYSINFYPELTGIGKYSGEMAAWMAARGHQVRVVAAPPYYPKWRIDTAYSSKSYRHERANGVDTWRCPLWVPARPSGFKRLLHIASFAISSMPIMLRQILWRPDVVVVIEPPLMCAPTALLVSWLTGACSWLHVQDLEVDAAFDLGILSANGMRSIVLSIESLLLRTFRRVSTISPNMQSKLQEKGRGRVAPILFPNWVDLEATYPMDNSSILRTELGIPESKIVALYSGNMGEKQGLEVVLDAAKRLEEDDHLIFVLCGEGATRQRLAQEYEYLQNVLWLPLQPLERLNDLLNLADIHLLPQKADVSDLVMPSKLTGMLASGRPIVATVQPETQVAHVIESCGLVTKPGDPEALADALLVLAKDSSRRTAMGRAARQYAESNLDQNTILKKFETALDTCAA